MTTNGSDPRVDVLGMPECEALLAQATMGRIAFIDASGPMVLPVNFVVAEGMIAFRTDSESLLAYAPMRQIALEIDGTDGPNDAWSVVVRGMAHEVTEAIGDRYEELRKASIPTLLSGPSHWLAFEPDRLSGRRITAR